MAFVVPFEKIKFKEKLITFTEVPDEITLCFNITGCPCHCKDCFEPWLAEDIGTELTYAVLEAEIASHKHISCVCFMGGDRYYDQIAVLVMELKREFPHLKWAIYSGRQEMNPILSQLMDYYKVGPYIPEYGPLNKETTNQRFYKKIDGEWKDFTFQFQKKKV